MSLPSAASRGSLPAVRKPSSFPSSSNGAVLQSSSSLPMPAHGAGKKLPLCGTCGTVFSKATAKFCAKCGTKKAAAPAKGAAAATGLSSGLLPPASPPRAAAGTGSGQRALKDSLASIGSDTLESARGEAMDPHGISGGGTIDLKRRSSASGTMPFRDNTAGAATPTGKAKHPVAKRQAAAAPSPHQPGPAPTASTSRSPRTSSVAAVGSPLPSMTVAHLQSAPAQDTSVASLTSPHHRDATALPGDVGNDSVNGACVPTSPVQRTRSPSLLVASAKKKPAQVAAAKRVVPVPSENADQRESGAAGRFVAATAGTSSLTVPTPTATVSATTSTGASGTLGSFRTIEVSAEEEAQYTAWATLGPEGLTPEMLQTHNAADELRLWRKGSLIGRGTYGSVYLGLLRDGSFYAVKCVEIGGRHVADMAFNAKELVSLSREINMMQRLKHRNLCTFKGVLFDADTTSICMFMEYVGGGSLSSIVKRFKPLPHTVVRRWTRQLLTGLLYLHAQHIIHRDIKGDNVLIDTSASPESEAQVKLVDFGAARRLTDAVSQSRTVIGTPYWMAPEVVDMAGEGKGYSYKADVWSVGCTVAEMLTGRPPWPAKATAPAAIMMVAATEGMPTEVPREEATAGCYAFMLRCFERDPERRPTVEELLQDPWILGHTE